MLDITCEYCQGEIRVEVPENDQGPVPGNLLLCTCCGEFLVFGEDLEFRKLELKELIDIQLSINWPVLEIVAIQTKVINGKWLTV